MAFKPLAHSPWGVQEGSESDTRVFFVQTVAALSVTMAAIKYCPPWIWEHLQLEFSGSEGVRSSKHACA